jgi:hypothetical protein
MLVNQQGTMVTVTGGFSRGRRCGRGLLGIGIGLLGVVGLLAAGAGSAGAATSPCGTSGTITINASNVVTGTTTCEGSVAIPDSVTGIADFAFSSASGVTSIQVPASVITIGTGAFAGAGVTSISVADANPNFRDIDGVLFSKGGSAVLGYPRGSTRTTYDIPTGVTTIGAFAFRSTQLEGVTVPSGMTTIGDSAFKGAVRLTAIEVPRTVSQIGDEAFSGTTALRTVTIAAPSSLTTIGEYAFYSSGLLSIAIPGSVTSIGSDAFDSARSLASVTFGPDSTLTTIAGWMFDGATSLTTITLPSTVAVIGRSAFNGASSLSSVYFTSAMAPTVGDYAFTGVASGATAYRVAGSTGFTTAGSPPRWYGLAVEEYLPAPQAPVAVAGVESATVTVVPAAVGPAASSYVITASPGSAQCTVTGASGACAFASLTAGTAYTFTAVARTTSPELTSLASPASEPVVPTAPAASTASADAGIAATAASPAAPFTIRGAPKQLAEGLVVTLVVNEPGVVGVRVTAVGARALRAEPVVLCSMRQRVAQAGRVTLVCSYTKAARALLARGAVRATQAITFRPAAGASVVTTSALTLKRLGVPAPSRVTG